MSAKAVQRKTDPVEIQGVKCKPNRWPGAFFESIRDAKAVPDENNFTVGKNNKVRVRIR